MHKVIGTKQKDKKRALLSASVGGVMVSIVAFQAVDPGSTPGQRTFLTYMYFPWSYFFTNDGSFIKR